MGTEWRILQHSEQVLPVIWASVFMLGTAVHTAIVVTKKMRISPHLLDIFT